MTYDEKVIFLSNIRIILEKNPELLNDTIQACVYGINKNIEVETKRAADMESVAMAAMTLANAKRYSKDTHAWAVKLINSKLDQNKDDLRFQWAHVGEPE